MAGTLHGLGVGPGDPELMTIKAWRILSLAPVVAWPRGTSGQALARRIAAPFIPEDALQLAIPIPFLGDGQAVKAAYAAAAEAIASHLRVNRDVAFLCLGDPFTYGTFGKLAELLAPRFDVRAVPGISAAQACAAAVGIPLTQGTESLRMLPATLPDERLRAALREEDAALAILKAGHHLARLRALLTQTGRLDHAFVAEQLGTTRERVLPMAKIGGGNDSSYFSTILVYPARRNPRHTRTDGAP